MRPRWRFIAPVALACGVALWWIAAPAVTPADAGPPAASSAAAAPASRAAVARHGAPWTAAGLAANNERLALWQQRLQRARQTLASYRESTRYPFDSRPAGEHADQWLTHPVITGDLPLRMPGAAVTPGLHVHTTQERVFATAGDTVQLTVSVADDNGNPLPLRVVSAIAHGEPKAGVAAPLVMQPFVDDATQGDAQAGDGVFSTRLDPQAEGFAGYAGLIRTELTLRSGDTQGYVAFDVVYSPQTPATWSGPVREALENGSLNLYLAADVAQPGRYVVTGRVDDATGKPFAFVSFNDELGGGAQQVALTIHGRLVRDRQPAFPLTLHDVEGFLLKPDTYPDRALMPTRDGVVHTTRRYALALFSDAAWSSEETARYIAEYAKDVAQAQQHVDQLQAASAP